METMLFLILFIKMEQKRLTLMVEGSIGFLSIIRRYIINENVNNRRYDESRGTIVLDENKQGEF